MGRTFYMLLAYDGTDFHGWQRQPGLRTVQGVLEESLQRVARHPVELIGSGRTDAGVHAAGQVASFVTTCPLASDRLRYAIGARLPEDVSLIALREVRPEFHATRSAVSKLYRYRIHNTPHRPVEQLTQRYTYHYWRKLDLKKMRAASRHFIGEMDFSAMATRGGERESMVRAVLRCDIRRQEREVRINVEGEGFLYNQVRNMVGTLLEVGRGRWEPDFVRDILASKDRAQAGPTVPASGLCLQWVRYPAELMSPPDVESMAEPPCQTETQPETEPRP